MAQMLGIRLATLWLLEVLVFIGRIPKDFLDNVSSWLVYGPPKTILIASLKSLKLGAKKLCPRKKSALKFICFAIELVVLVVPVVFGIVLVAVACVVLVAITYN